MSSAPAKPGPRLVKIDEIGEVQHHSKGISNAFPPEKNYLVSITPVTLSEMKYISSTCPAVRVPLGELHVAKHRARSSTSQDDLDAHQATSATRTVPRTASVSPEFLSRSAGLRYDTVERLRDVRRIQHNDPAALYVASYTTSDEDVVELSPHRKSPTQAAREATRSRFDSMIKRLTLSQKPALADPAVISCRLRSNSSSKQCCTDQAEWEYKMQRGDSGYHGSPQRAEDRERKDSGATAAVASGMSSPTTKNSYDSGFYSPSKSMSLNPMALEFVSVKDTKQSATVSGGLGPSRFARKPLTDLFIPPPKMQLPSPVPGPALGDLRSPIQLEPSFVHEVVPATQQQSAFNINDPTVRATMAAIAPSRLPQPPVPGSVGLLNMTQPGPVQHMPPAPPAPMPSTMSSMMPSMMPPPMMPPHGVDEPAARHASYGTNGSNGTDAAHGIYASNGGDAIHDSDAFDGADASNGVDGADGVDATARAGRPSRPRSAARAVPQAQAPEYDEPAELRGVRRASQVDGPVVRG